MAWNKKLIANWCKFGFFFECNEENLFVYLLNFFNSACGQFRALFRFRADCRRNRGIARRSADTNECACWPGSSQEKSARKVFPSQESAGFVVSSKLGTHAGFFDWGRSDSDDSQPYLSILAFETSNLI
jgi:hypothetical protein